MKRNPGGRCTPRWQVGELSEDEKHNFYSKLSELPDLSEPQFPSFVKWGKKGMLKGLNEAKHEKYLAWYLANHIYLIRILMMIINGANL